jgi:hypothetical protein
MIYDLRFTMVRGAREFSGSAGILPAGSRVAGRAARRQDAGAPGGQSFSISHSK